MKVTNEMLYAAVKQGVKEGLLPKEAPIEMYSDYYDKVKRMLEAALSDK